jgi:hypothetical protein
MAQNQSPKSSESTESSLRPPKREENPRERAAKRAADIRKHFAGLDEGADEFFIPPQYVPDGWTYEWKRHTIFNQEDPAYQVQLAREGWEVVPTSRHPEMMPSGDYPYIARKGMILMERPREITEESRRFDSHKARAQVRTKEQQLGNAPDGQFERNHGNVKPKIGKSYAPIPVPDE